MTASGTTPAAEIWNKLTLQLVADGYDARKTPPPIRSGPTRNRPSRNRPARAAAISLAAALVVALAAARIWWGMRSSSPFVAEGPSAAALPETTRMGAAELLTGDLAPMRSFYVDAVSLEVLSESTDQLRLGSNGEELLRIGRAEGLAAGLPTGAGLYHSAILYPNEKSLADTLLSVATVAPRSYSGSADHAVSLAFYFTDPDGNGLDLYTDTPEDTWVWKGGLVTVGSTPLDPNAFIAQHSGADQAQAQHSGADQAQAQHSGADPAQALPTMGHVHLRVGDLSQARSFYADTLAFAVTAESEGALFCAAGGYHHHVATNTWDSAGAGQRIPSRGLGSLSMHRGKGEALQAVATRLTESGVDFVHNSDGITVDAPWGNTVRLLA